MNGDSRVLCMFYEVGLLQSAEMAARSTPQFHFVAITDGSAEKVALRDCSDAQANENTMKS